MYFCVKRYKNMIDEITKYFESHNYESIRIENDNNAQILYEVIFNNGELCENPDNVELAHHLGIICVVQHKYDAAEKYYLIAIQNNYNVSMYNLANMYAKQKKYDYAEKYYFMAIENGYNKALNNLAYMCEIQNKYDDAEKYYLINIERNNNISKNNLVDMYEKQNKHDEILIIYHKYNKYLQFNINEHVHSILTKKVNINNIRLLQNFLPNKSGIIKKQDFSMTDQILLDITNFINEIPNNLNDINYETFETIKKDILPYRKFINNEIIILPYFIILEICKQLFK